MSAFASLHLGHQTATRIPTSTRAPASHPHGLRPEPGSWGSHRSGHIHLAPPQPDHRPDMTWRGAATAGGTGSGQVTPSVGQTESRNPSEPTPHSLSCCSGKHPRAGQGLQGPHSRQAGVRQAVASVPPPVLRGGGPWTCSTGPLGRGRTGLSDVMDPRQPRAGGSEYGLDLISQAVWSPAGPRKMENKHQDRPEEERKVGLEAIDITEQKTRISTIKVAVGYTRLG